MLPRLYGQSRSRLQKSAKYSNKRQVEFVSEQWNIAQYHLLKYSSKEEHDGHDCGELEVHPKVSSITEPHLPGCRFSFGDILTDFQPLASPSLLLALVPTCGHSLLSQRTYLDPEGAAILYCCRSTFLLDLVGQPSCFSATAFEKLWFPVNDLCPRSVPETGIRKQANPEKKRLCRSAQMWRAKTPFARLSRSPFC